MSRITRILITLDVHSYPDTEKEIPQFIKETLKIFNKLNIKATFFFPAIFAEQYSKQVRMILSEGHEIGCHGLAHKIDELYNYLPYEKQRSLLKEAKEKIEQIASREIISFRAPVFKINGNTIRALEDNGFKADLSVNPQRLGIFSSEVDNIGWLYSPRIPYHPDFNNPFRKGKSSLWEIPQSAFIVPFISNTGIAFGGVFMKWFYKILYLEAKLAHNPIVYMAHVEDIYPCQMRHEYKFEWSHLLPTRTQGFILRYFLFHNKDGRKISRDIINLLETIKEINNSQFLTVNEMVSLLEVR